MSTQNVPVCTFKTSPCVPPPRAHVETVCRCDLRLAQHKGLEFWQTIHNAIIVYDAMPAGCVVKGVKRNLDDTEAESVFEKAQLEQREVLHVVLKDKPPAKFGRDLVRKERISILG